MKKITKRKSVSIRLPLDVVKFYKKVAKLSGTTFSQTILVITAAHVLKEKSK